MNMPDIKHNGGWMLELEVFVARSRVKDLTESAKSARVSWDNRMWIRGNLY